MRVKKFHISIQEGIENDRFLMQGCRIWFIIKYGRCSSNGLIDALVESPSNFRFFMIFCDFLSAGDKSLL